MSDQPVKGFDYSKTLYLPKTDFPMRAGLPDKEPEILARWERDDLYGAVRRNSAGLYRIFKINGGVTATIYGLTIANGHDGDCSGGGGIHNAGTLTVNQCAISGNFGCIQGGGIFNTGSLTINRSTLTGNLTSGFYGGGIYNRGTLAVENSTISGNNGTSLGGGLYNDGGAVTFVSSTIANNGTNGIRNNSGTVQAKNAIFAPARA